ncbi:MAG: hypothetical protein MUP36_01290 [Demequinaceae bacterium]|nr:hypothetical protein [Demequinaceae bacterium]
MKRTLTVIAALGALALSACSSDATPDASTGDGNPTPQVTTPDSNPGSSDFCQMIGNGEAMNDDLTTASDAITALIDDQENWDSPEAVADLHTQGQILIDYADDVTAIYNQAAKEAGDPEVAEAFSTFSEYLQLFFRGMGQAAVEADSVMDYIMNMGTYLNDDRLLTLTNDLSEVGPIISDYVYDTCGHSGFDD